MARAAFAVAVVLGSAARSDAQAPDAPQSPPGFDVVDPLIGSGGWARSVSDPRTGIVFLLIEPGSFLLGSPDGVGEEDERPARDVTLDRPGYLARDEVTVPQWRRFAEATKHRTEAETKFEGWTHNAAGGTERITGACWKRPLPAFAARAEAAPNHPVTHVSWQDAQAFCAHYGYRLPTEVLWEYACRAGRSGLYPWGDFPRGGKGRGNYGDRSQAEVFALPDPFPIDDGFTFQAEVDASSIAPNAWGFRHMLGNVWEWCADAYDERGVDLTPRDVGAAPFRVLRGGSWMSSASLSRPSRRAFQAVHYASDLIGFRVAFELGTLPVTANGARARTTVGTTVDSEGLLVFDGAYERIDGDGSQETGVFQQGRKAKSWERKTAAGRTVYAGLFRNGQRSNGWRLEDSQKRTHAHGAYEAGWRVGAWTFQLFDGAPDRVNSGVYAHRFELHPGTPQLACEGETVDDLAHGIWTAWWPNGQTMLRGRFQRGIRAGSWMFWHADGTPDPQMISGTFENGTRTGPCGTHEWRPKLVTPPSRPLPRERIALDRLGDLPIAPERSTEDDRRLEAFLRGDAGAAKELVEHGRRSVPRIVARLVRQDVFSTAGSSSAQKLHAELLHPIFGDRSYAWLVSTKPEDALANQLTIARWHSLASLAGPVFWEIEVPANPSVRGAELLFDLPAGVFPRDVLAAREAAAETGSQPQSIHRWRDATPASAGVEKIVQAGLGWLARHQSAQGGWGHRALRERCDSSTPCFDPKSYSGTRCDIGLTALSVLAFLSAGFGPESDARLADVDATCGEVVMRGLGWLVRQQKPASGEIVLRGAQESAADQAYELGTRCAESRFFDQVFAAMALCEAAAVVESETLHSAARRSIAYLVRTQKPSPTGEGNWGWGYLTRAEAERTGAQRELFEADTLITGLVAAALDTARSTGVEVPAETWSGALSFCKWVTGDGGLVGYIDPRGAGQTLTGKNDHFTYHPTTMSALGMCIRLFAQSKRDDPFLELAAKRIVADLPFVTKDRLSTDSCYWYVGSLALSQLDGPDAPGKSGKYWGPWQKAMVDAIGALQDKSERTCSRGGWILGDRWSYAGGPVYSTAIHLVTLATTTRHKNHPAPANPKKPNR